MASATVFRLRYSSMATPSHRGVCSADNYVAPKQHGNDKGQARLTPAATTHKRMFTHNESRNTNRQEKREREGERKT